MASGAVLSFFDIGAGASLLVGTVLESIFAGVNAEEATLLRERQEKLQKEAKDRQEEIMNELRLLREAKGTLVSNPFFWPTQYQDLLD